MITSVGHVTVPVGDYDEALRWFTDKLGLEVRADSAFGPGYRWITVGAAGQRDMDLVLHLSSNRREHREVEGAPPLLVFHTEDCLAEFDSLKARGVTFLRGPQDVPWGKQAMFLDPFGNCYVLVERREAKRRDSAAA